MNLLQYTSNEMFSSTELIRKSKNIFDKLNHEEIEKAVILRDGKPSFMLMDFYKYEKLISEYIDLKNEFEILKSKKVKISKPQEEIKNELIEESKNLDTDEVKKTEEIKDEDLQDALSKIDELDFNLNDKRLQTEKSNKSDQQLNDFWE